MIDECVKSFRKLLDGVKDNGQDDIKLVEQVKQGCRKSIEILMKRHYGRLVIGYIKGNNKTYEPYMEDSDVLSIAISAFEAGVMTWNPTSGIPLITHITRNVELRTRGKLGSLRRKNESHIKGVITQFKRVAIDGPLANSNGKPFTVTDTMGDYDDIYANIWENRRSLILQDALKNILNEREWFTVTVDEYDAPLKDVAKCLNISQERVRQIRANAYTKLRRALIAKGFDQSNLESFKPTCRHH